MSHAGIPSHEGRIILPLRDTALERQLVEHFGGFTRYYGEGAWLSSENKVVEEPIVIYDVAARPHDTNMLLDIAVAAGHRQNQQAVYVKFPLGAVEIVDLHKGKEG